MPNIKEFLCGVFCALLVIQVCCAKDASAVYRIDPARSVMHVYTDSAGLLSRLGHHHIVSLKGLSGHVEMPTPDSGSARLFLAPDKFVVDAPADRANAAPPYNSAINSEDRAATRHNMLGSMLLNVARYPRIDIAVDLSALQGERADFAVRVGLQGRVYPFRISGRLLESGDDIVVSAAFFLNHREIGLQPYSALAGMLKVAETLRFDIKLIASRVDGVSARDIL